MKFLGFSRFQWFVGFCRLGFSRFEFSRSGFSTLEPGAPFGFASEAVDTELAEEFEMVVELIGGHD